MIRIGGFSIRLYMLLAVLQFAGMVDVSAGQELSVTRDGCTTILVGKQRSEQGSVLMGHNEDMGRESGCLRFVERSVCNSETVRLKYESLSAVPETSAYWATGNSTPVAEAHYEGGWILCGMNEHGVAMACNSMYTREERIPKGRGLFRYSIRRLVMERAQSARDAAELIGGLIDEYTQCDSPVTYCLADAREAWIIETTYRHWVAKRIDDDAVHAVANQYTIEENWDMAGDGLVEYAVQRGWYEPASKTPFSFKAAYCDPARLNRLYDTSREMQVREMFAENTAVSVEDVRVALALPPVQTALTQSFMVFEGNDAYPASVGCVMWFGMGSAAAGLLSPLYPVGGSVPQAYGDSSLDGDSWSAWWRFKHLQEAVYPSRWIYDEAFQSVRAVLDNVQADIYSAAGRIAEQAVKYHDRGDDESVASLLSDHTNRQLEHVLKTVDSVLKTSEVK